MRNPIRRKSRRKPDITASKEVIFASTELLGPHRFRSVFEQTEFHGEDVRNTHREVLSIDWVDWDHWQATHMVDDDVVMQVIIMDSICLEQVSGQFVKRPDGEPYRVQLRSMWNQWDSIMRHFEPHSTWTDNGTSTMEKPHCTSLHRCLYRTGQYIGGTIAYGTRRRCLGR